MHCNIVDNLLFVGIDTMFLDIDIEILLFVGIAISMSFERRYL